MTPGVTVPGAAYVACALGILFYQTLDAIDGKQARRTGSSSPLGELFDHGCDAVSTIFVTLAILTSLQLGSDPWTVLWTAVTASTVFYVAHWECYVKGSLVVGAVDVTETQLMMAAVHCATAAFGAELWAYDVGMATAGVELQLKSAILIFIWGVSWLTIFKKIGSILEGGPGDEGTTPSETSILAPLFPIALLWAETYYLASHETVLALGVTLMLGVGFAFARLTNKLILGHMSKSALEQWDAVHWGPVAFFANDYLGLGFAPHVMASCCVLFWITCHGMYSFNLCSEIADGLDIMVFSIAKKNGNNKKSS